MLIPIFAAWIAADLVTGVVHWWEDRYGDPAWPILGPHVIRPNILHHTDQTAFLRSGVIERNWTTAVPALAVAAALACAGWRWGAMVAAFCACANEVHAWSHQRCSRPIRGLQLLGLLASPADHARHHTAPFATDFCVMTGWSNPALSAIGFWPALEAVVGLFGIQPRPERATA